MSLKHRAFVFAVVVCLGLVAPPRADELPCQFEGIERVVAVGDVHGAYGQLVRILQTAGIIDQRLRWTGGRTHFVSDGDILDRGPDSRKVLDLYRRLEREASSAGGHVHYLLGNHEAMRLTGDFRYIDPGEYAAFATGASEAVQREYVENADPVLGNMIARLPLGGVELIRAFGSRETYGRYLRGLNAVVRINGVVFVHGGISPAYASMSCTTINTTIRRELSNDKELDKVKAAPLASFSFGTDGPLWYRGLGGEPVGEPEDTFAPAVDEILRGQQARAMVIAHTVQEPTFRIGVRFGGRILAIDTGFQPKHVAAGRPSALELRGGVFTAIYLDRRDVVGNIPAAPSAPVP